MRPRTQSFPDPIGQVHIGMQRPWQHPKDLHRVQHGVPALRGASGHHLQSIRPGKGKVSFLQGSCQWLYQPHSGATVRRFLILKMRGFRATSQPLACRWSVPTLGWLRGGLSPFRESPEDIVTLSCNSEILGRPREGK